MKGGTAAPTAPRALDPTTQTRLDQLAQVIDEGTELVKALGLIKQLSGSDLDHCARTNDLTPLQHTSVSSTPFCLLIIHLLLLRGADPSATGEVSAEHSAREFVEAVENEQGKRVFREWDGGVRKGGDWDKARKLLEAATLEEVNAALGEGEDELFTVDREHAAPTPGATETVGAGETSSAPRGGGSPGARMSDQQLADAIGEAVEDADVKKVLSLVKKATPFVINLPHSETNLTPLQVAASDFSPAIKVIMELLLLRGASLDTAPPTPVDLAASVGNTEGWNTLMAWSKGGKEQATFAQGLLNVSDAAGRAQIDFADSVRADAARKAQKKAHQAQYQQQQQAQQQQSMGPPPPPPRPPTRALNFEFSLPPKTSIPPRPHSTMPPTSNMPPLLPPQRPGTSLNFTVDVRKGGVSLGQASAGPSLGLAAPRLNNGSTTSIYPRPTSPPARSTTVLPLHAPSAESTPAPNVWRIVGLPPSTRPEDIVPLLSDLIPRGSIDGVTITHPSSTFGEAVLVKVDKSVTVGAEVISSVLTTRQPPGITIDVDEAPEPIIILQHLPGSATLPQVISLVQEAGSPARVLHLSEVGAESGERYALVAVPEYEDADKVVASLSHKPGISCGWVSADRVRHWSWRGGVLTHTRLAERTYLGGRPRASQGASLFHPRPSSLPNKPVPIYKGHPISSKPINVTAQVSKSVPKPSLKRLSLDVSPVSGSNAVGIGSGHISDMPPPSKRLALNRSTFSFPPTPSPARLPDTFTRSSDFLLTTPSSQSSGSGNNGSADRAKETPDSSPETASLAGDMSRDLELLNRLSLTADGLREMTNLYLRLKVGR